MKMRKFIVSAAAAAMVMGSTVAQAAPVAVDNSRSGSSMTGENLENSSHLWLGLLGLGLLIFVLFAINDNDGEEDLPHSP
jgi:hypothetical protein